MYIDIHAHTRLRPGPPRDGSERIWATPEQLIEMYDEVGIEKAVLLPGSSPEGVAENLEIVELYPGRFIPFCNVNPEQGPASDADLGELLESYKARGCPGIGELTANVYFDDPMVENLFRHAERVGMVVTFHVATQKGGTYGLIDDLNMPRFEKMLQKFSDLNFLCHSQAWWSEISGDVTEENRGGYPEGPVVEGGRVVELMRRYPNVYGDLSANSGYNAVSRDPDFGYEFLTEFQDRLCFGTDVNAPSHRDNVLVYLKNFLEEALAGGKMSQQVFDKVARENAVKLLGL